MVAVGITMDYARYRATVHYLTCHYWTGLHTHINRQIPPSTKIRMCVWCRPTAEDVVTIAREINWVEKTADAMTRCVPVGTSFGGEEFEGEKLASRLELSGGRTLGKRRSDEWFD